MSDLHEARVTAAANAYQAAQNADPYDFNGRMSAALAAADAVVTVPPLHPDEFEPVATNPLLRGVDLALERLIRRDCFTERTLRVIDELREEIAILRGGEEQ